MIFKLTAKGVQIPEQTYKHINSHLNKIARILPDVEEDLIVLRFNLKKNVDKYHPQKSHAHPHKSYSDKKTELAYYEGAITFRLEKKQLYVHFKGQTINECVNLGFERIFEEIEKFKDLHFSSTSKYPDHKSIRGE